MAFVNVGENVKTPKKNQLTSLLLKDRGAHITTTLTRLGSLGNVELNLNQQDAVSKDKVVILYLKDLSKFKFLEDVALRSSGRMAPSLLTPT